MSSVAVRAKVDGKETVEVRQDGTQDKFDVIEVTVSLHIICSLQGQWA